MTTFCFPVIHNSILVLSGKGSGWLELRSLSAGRILPCISNCWTGSHELFQEFRGSMFSLYRRSLKRGAVFFGRFLAAPIITENSCIQLSIGGGGNVHSLYSSCELGLFSGHLQMRSCPCNPDPTLGMIVEFKAQAFAYPRTRLRLPHYENKYFASIHCVLKASSEVDGGNVFPSRWPFRRQNSTFLHSGNGDGFQRWRGELSPVL